MKLKSITSPLSQIHTQYTAHTGKHTQQSPVAMIHSVLIFNNHCQPRLAKFYVPLPVNHQQLLLKQVHQLVEKRDKTQSSFLSIPPLLQQNYALDSKDIRVIYKFYSTLYFVFIVDSAESELGILDLIQVFVQVLNECFDEVSEYDLVFHWEVMQIALEEMIQGGMVIETNIQKIMAAIDLMNGGEFSMRKRNDAKSLSDIAAGAGRGSFFSRWPIT